MASDDVEANVDRAEESSNQAVAKQNHKVTSNKNKAAKNSNQAVANIIHNLTSVMYGNKQTALVCAIVCVVGLGFGGLLIGLYFRNSHQ